MTQLRVLILGDGFVGRRMRQAVEGSDWGALTRVTAGFDPHRADQLTAALAAADVVINATYGKPATIRAIATRLYEVASRAASQARIVHVGSMTVYGSVTGVIDESADLRADLGEYSQAQRDAERLAAGYANSVVLRPGCEYGPDCPDWSERIAKLLMAGRLGDLGAAGDGYCNLLFIEDLIQAMSAAARITGVGGQAFNLAMSQPPTWNQYFTRFAKALGAVPLRRVGRRKLRWETKILAPPLKIMELLGSRMGLVGKLPAVLTPSLIGVCGQEIRLDVRKAESALGQTWTRLEEGLTRAAAFYAPARALAR
jgi:2-alkyl-3-oxoalkanoate reductase